MTTTPEYDALVRKLTVERESKMRKVTQLSEAETAKEIADITEGVFIEPVPIIMPTGPELDVVAKTLEQMQPKKRGRPKGSKNRPKEPK